MAKIHIADTGLSYHCNESDTILRAGLRAGLGLPYECNTGGCGTCKFEILEGEVQDTWSDAPGLSERDRRKNRHLGCQSRPIADCQIKVRLDESCTPLHRPTRLEATLRQIIPITHDISEFHFASGEPASFLPGQYALLDIPGVAGPRAYSMANTTNTNGDWVFQIRYVPGGQATRHLFEHMRAGAKATIDGPYGLAFLRTKSARDIICIGGGSGLAPMLSIARGMVQNDEMAHRNLHFFYGGRTPRDICGEAALQELPSFNQRIFYYPVVSMPSEHEPWNGDTGYVHDAVIRKLANDLANYEYYMAGPPPMVQAIQDTLLERHSVPSEQMHFDRFF